MQNDDVSEFDDVTELLDETSIIERERDDYLNSLQRLQADFENYRKRAIRLSEEAATRASGDLVVKLLPVLDAFDLAQAHFAATPTDESEALSQSRALLLDALAKEGLERIDDVGVTFAGAAIPYADVQRIERRRQRRDQACDHHRSPAEPVGQHAERILHQQSRDHRRRDEGGHRHVPAA